jgi:hypothetical protein
MQDKLGKLLIFVLLAFGGSLTAEPPAVSLGAWTNLSGFPNSDYGMYGSIGLVQGISSRLELSTFTLAQLTPAPFSSLYQGAGIGLSLLQPRTAELPDAPSFINSFFEAGFLFGIHNLYNRSENPLDTTLYLYARVTPLSLGNVYYGSRDRIASLGVLYNLSGKDWGVFWNCAIYDRYL